MAISLYSFELSGCTSSIVPYLLDPLINMAAFMLPALPALPAPVWYSASMFTVPGPGACRTNGASFSSQLEAHVRYEINTGSTLSFLALAQPSKF
jgi:hypothetical protein